VAYDSFYPDNKANTTVRITVTRNPNAPQFSQSAYTTEINEYHPFGLTVFTVSAGDADQVREFTFLKRHNHHSNQYNCLPFIL
jgi:hypothetical protein